MNFIKGETAEKEPLVFSKDEEVGRLQLKHVPMAVKTQRLAFADDPMGKYFDTGNMIFRISVTFSLFFQYILAIRYRYALQIGGGRSICLSEYAPKDPRSRKPLWYKTFEKIVKSIIKFFVWFDPELKKRSDESNRKLGTAIKEALGDDGEEMMCLQLLCTQPNYQGRGYASRLVEAINDMADHDTRAVWLVSSNIKNEAFYNSHGFYAVREIVLGDDNPKWKKPGVVVQVMVRKKLKN